MIRPFHPYKVSAVYRTHVALGARWVEEDGWRLVEVFTDPESEARQAAAAVGIHDESPLGKLEVTGRQAAELLARFGPVPAGVGSSALPLGEGRPARCLRLAAERFLLVTPAAACETVRRALDGSVDRPACVHVTDLTSGLAAFALLGPRARDLLARVTAFDLRARSFPDGACAEGPLAAIRVLLAREDWGTLPAYQILLARELGEYGWDALCEAGHALGLVPVGRAAARLLREGNVACTSS